MPYAIAPLCTRPNANDRVHLVPVEVDTAHIVAVGACLGHVEHERPARRINRNAPWVLKQGHARNAIAVPRGLGCTRDGGDILRGHVPFAHGAPAVVSNVKCRASRVLLVKERDSVRIDKLRPGCLSVLVPACAGARCSVNHVESGPNFDPPESAAVVVGHVQVCVPGRGPRYDDPLG